MNTPAFDQIAFHFRNDDGTEATATQRQAPDVDDTNQELDTVYRVRIGYVETADNAASNKQVALEAQIDGGGFVAVTDISADIQIAASQLVDEGDTPQRITSGTYVAVTGNQGQEETNGNAGRATFVGLDQMECEWSYQFLSSGSLSGGETVDFRIVGMDAYTAPDATTTITGTPPVGPPSGLRTLALTGAGI